MMLAESRYLLDANVCIRYLNGRSPAIRTHLEAAAREKVYVCSIVNAEMFAGALRSNNPARSLKRQQAFFARFVSLPFDDAAAESYGQIRAHLLSAGIPIGANDMLIAAIAIANGLTPITHNTDEFARVAGLVWENWEA